MIDIVPNSFKMYACALAIAGKEPNNQISVKNATYVNATTEKVKQNYEIVKIFFNLSYLKFVLTTFNVFFRIYFIFDTSQHIKLHTVWPIWCVE